MSWCVQCMLALCFSADGSLICFAVAIVAQIIWQHSLSASVFALTMKRPAILQDDGARARRCRTTAATMAVLQCTAIDPTNKEAPAAANHHPATSPTAVCPDAAMVPNKALAHPPAALASEASGMDDLDSEASAGTRLTYLALAAMAKNNTTPMPQLPPIDDYDMNDRVI